MSKEREDQLRNEVETGHKDPAPLVVKNMIEIVHLLYDRPLNDSPGLVVEDENGEIRHITFAWYDKQRDMIRLTVGETKFEDCELEGE